MRLVSTMSPTLRTVRLIADGRSKLRVGRGFSYVLRHARAARMAADGAQAQP